MDVDESKHYSVIVLNSDFEDPPFNASEGVEVNYELDLYGTTPEFMLSLNVMCDPGCPTVTQRLVIVFIVVGFLFASQH